MPGAHMRNLYRLRTVGVGYPDLFDAGPGRSKCKSTPVVRPRRCPVLVAGRRQFSGTGTSPGKIGLPKVHVLFQKAVNQGASPRDAHALCAFAEAGAFWLRSPAAGRKFDSLQAAQG